MGKRTDHFMSAAVRAAERAKEWAIVAAREADRLSQEARKRVESEDRQRRLKRTLSKTGRVLRAAGQAALVAGVLAGIAAVRAERAGRTLPAKRGRKLAGGR
jgi:hypothetical protein